MFDGEVFKPSNTGKLIADVLPNTLAFQWSRTEPDAQLLAALQDTTRQPYLIFPESYAQNERVVVNEPTLSDKPALFILLDGTWPEARKMFRKALILMIFQCFQLIPKQGVITYYVHHQGKSNIVPLKLQLPF